MAQILKETRGYKNLVFIGDGATDLEASPPAVSLVLSLVSGVAQYIQDTTCMSKRSVA